MKDTAELSPVAESLKEVIAAVEGAGDVSKVVKKVGPYAGVGGLLLLIKELPEPLMPESISKVGGFVCINVGVRVCSCFSVYIMLAGGFCWLTLR